MGLMKERHRRTSEGTSVTLGERLDVYATLRVSAEAEGEGDAGKDREHFLLTRRESTARILAACPVDWSQEPPDWMDEEWAERVVAASENMEKAFDDHVDDGFCTQDDLDALGYREGMCSEDYVRLVGKALKFPEFWVRSWALDRRAGKVDWLWHASTGMIGTAMAGSPSSLSARGVRRALGLDRIQLPAKGLQTMMEWASTLGWETERDALVCAVAPIAPDMPEIAHWAERIRGCSVWVSRLEEALRRVHAAVHAEGASALKEAKAKLECKGVSPSTWSFAMEVSTQTVPRVEAVAPPAAAQAGVPAEEGAVRPTETTGSVVPDETTALRGYAEILHDVAGIAEAALATPPGVEAADALRALSEELRRSILEDRERTSATAAAEVSALLAGYRSRLGRLATESGSETAAAEAARVASAVAPLRSAETQALRTASAVAAWAIEEGERGLKEATAARAATASAPFSRMAEAAEEAARAGKALAAPRGSGEGSRRPVRRGGRRTPRGPRRGEDP